MAMEASVKQYADFELWVDSPTGLSASDSSTYPVHVIISPVGPASGTLVLNVDSQDFHNRLTVVCDEGPDKKKRTEFGQDLFEKLFCGKVRSAWDKSREGLRDGKTDGLRLRMWINDPQLAALPWELMYEDGMDFLATATNLAVSRYLPVPEPPQLSILKGLRVLIVVESPPRLSEITEKQVIDLKAAVKNLGRPVDFALLRNPSIQQIQAALQKDPHVLHFLGHGTAGALALTAAGEQSTMPIEDEAFAQLFLHRSSVRLVVLTACHSSQASTTELFSGVGPALVRKGVPAVVAMQYPAVDVDTALKFSSALYGALSKGIPVDFAVNEARQLLYSADPDRRDWSTPVLYLGTRQGCVWSGGEVEPVPKLWSRAMVDLDRTTMKTFRRLGKKVVSMREMAQRECSRLLSEREPAPSEVNPNHVRVNVFLPDMRDVEQAGDVCALYIPPKLHAGMDSNSEERKIRFRTNEGLTGRVYTEQRPLGAQWETTNAKWKRIDLEGRNPISDMAFSLTEAQRAVLHRELRWIISIPLKVSADGETLGVVNIDGLVDTLGDEEMCELYQALRGKAAEFTSALDKLPKCRVTISVANLGN